MARPDRTFFARERECYDDMIVIYGSMKDAESERDPILEIGFEAFRKLFKVGINLGDILEFKLDPRWLHLDDKDRCMTCFVLLDPGERERCIGCYTDVVREALISQIHQ